MKPNVSVIEAGVSAGKQIRSLELRVVFIILEQEGLERETETFSSRENPNKYNKHID